MLVHAYRARAAVRLLPARLLAGRPAKPVPILCVVPQQPTDTESTLFLLRGKLRLTAKVKACPKAVLGTQRGHVGEGRLRVAELRLRRTREQFRVSLGERMCSRPSLSRPGGKMVVYAHASASPVAAVTNCGARHGLKPPTVILGVQEVSRPYVCSQGCILSRSSGGEPGSWPFPVSRGPAFPGSWPTL